MKGQMLTNHYTDRTRILETVRLIKLVASFISFLPLLGSVEADAACCIQGLG